MKTITVKEGITVKKLAKKLKISSAELITKFFLQGKMVTRKEKLDYEHLSLIRDKYVFSIYCSFENYIKRARDEFVTKVRTQKWNTEMRTASEDILIAYDQMAEKLKG